MSNHRKSHRSPRPNKLNFYIHELSQGETNDLTETNPDDLFDEIDLMRVAIRRIFTLIKEESDLRIVLQALNAVTNACSRMAVIMATQKQVLEDTDQKGLDLDSALTQAMEGVKCSLPVPPQLPSGSPSAER